MFSCLNLRLFIFWLALPLGATTPTGSPEFLIETPQTAAVVLNAADFGMSPSEPDNTAKLQAALDACRYQGPAKLVIPKGTYYFASTQRVSIHHLSDLEIDGQGSELIWREHGFIGISKVSRVWIHDLTLDWDWQRDALAHYARLRSKADQTVVLDFPHVADISTNIRWINTELIEPETFAPAPGGGEIYVYNMSPKNIRKEGPPNQLTLESKWFSQWPVGSAFRLRQYDYKTHAVLIAQAQHLKFERVNIWSAPGMAYVVNEGSQYLEWQQCKITPRPGSNRVMSTASDGIHTSNTHGYIKIEGCEFSHQGDDAVNIKDNNTQGLTRADNRTLHLPGTPAWRVAYAEGDVLEFRRPDFSPIGLSPPIHSVTRLADDSTQLSFKAPLPRLKPDSIVLNTRYLAANYIIRNNYFHSNRARGLLLKAPHGTIEGNTLRATMAQAIKFETGAREGREVHNVLLRNNKFIDCNRYKAGDAVVVFEFGARTQAPTRRKLFRDFLIQANLFEKNPVPPLQVRHAKNIMVRGNQCTSGGPSSAPSDCELSSN